MVIPWIMISIGVLIVLLGIVAFILFKKGKRHEPDYYNFFIIGVIWTAFGIIFYDGMFFFLLMGIVFMVLGLANKDKWKKNHRTWKQLSKSEKKFKIIIFILLGIGVLAGLVLWFLYGKGIL